MKKIVVVGSINIDLVTACDHFPAIGESMFGTSFNIFCGGKGANQAICAAKLGAEVTMIGCVGNDANGQLALDNFKKYQVNIDSIVKVNTATGIALIIVADNDNEIVVIKGANACVDIEVVKQAKEKIINADMVVMQLEIPIKTIDYVLDLCKENKIPVILNPAPYQPICDEMLEKVTYLTPNQVEVKQLFGEEYHKVLSNNPNKIIMTAGSAGVYYHDGSLLQQLKTSKVKVVDTTGAGDTFTGALAVALTNDYSLDQAINFAQKAAGIAIGKMGAQTAMPTLDEMK